MTPPIIVTKSTKSVGIAILLTLLFGPIGLFYASITGGLIMTFLPILLYILFFVGLFQDDMTLLYTIASMGLIYLLTFWIINMIWAVISVNNYNREIQDEALRQQYQWNEIYGSKPNQIIVNLNQDKTIPLPSESSRIEIGSGRSMQDWFNENPGKTINDYYRGLRK